MNQTPELRKALSIAYDQEMGIIEVTDEDFTKALPGMPVDNSFSVKIANLKTGDTAERVFKFDRFKISIGQEI
jgi:hypothetical protein